MFIILLISSGIIGPIYEEILFRYILLNRLKKFNSTTKSIIIPKDRSVIVNETVMKTSVGALNHVNIIMVTNLVNAINKLKNRGYFAYAADMDGKYFREVDYSDKVLLTFR